MTTLCFALVTGCSTEPCELYIRQLAAEATLTPDDVVPPVDDTAIAWAHVSLSESDRGRGYDVDVIAAPPQYACCDILATLPTMDVESATAVHIHEGRPGENGDVLLTLSRVSVYPDYQSYYLANDLGTTFTTDQFDIIGRGRSYVDVHTTSFPDGQVRGQLEPLSYDETVRCVRPD